jgi:hypothetical protein
MNGTIPWKRGEVFVPIVLGILFTPFLMIACRLVVRKGVDFGDCLKSSVAATVATFFLDVGLKYLLAGDTVLFWAASSGLALVTWTIVLQVIIGLRVRETLAIAAIFTVMRIPLILLIKNGLIDPIIRQTSY